MIISARVKENIINYYISAYNHQTDRLCCASLITYSAAASRLYQLVRMIKGIVQPGAGWSAQKIKWQPFQVESQSTIWPASIPSDLVELVITWLVVHMIAWTQSLSLQLKAKRPTHKSLHPLSALILFWKPWLEVVIIYICCFDASFRCLATCCKFLPKTLSSVYKMCHNQSPIWQHW